jgi:hypothetical protein
MIRKLKCCSARQWYAWQQRGDVVATEAVPYVDAATPAGCEHNGVRGLIRVEDCSIHRGGVAQHAGFDALGGAIVQCHLPYLRGEFWSAVMLMM